MRRRLHLVRNRLLAELVAVGAQQGIVGEALAQLRRHERRAQRRLRLGPQQLSETVLAGEHLVHTYSCKAYYVGLQRLWPLWHAVIGGLASTAHIIRSVKVGTTRPSPAGASSLRTLRWLA